MALKRSSVRFRLAPPTPNEIAPVISIERSESVAKLTDFKALTFDCYGTLIDWESGDDRGPEAPDEQSVAAA